MRITWFGHAAFLIESGRYKIIMDPYNSTCGYTAIKTPASIVTISHINEKYHSYRGDIPGDFVTVNGLELPKEGKVVDGLRFHGTTVYEDDAGEGPNAIVHFTLEGLKIAHLGDLGHALDARQRASLAGTDILLALAGGKPTLALPDLLSLMKSLRPAITIPMHFKTPKIDLNILPVDDFLALCEPESVVRQGATYLEVSRATLPESPQVIVLDHLG